MSVSSLHDVGYHRGHDEGLISDILRTSKYKNIKKNLSLVTKIAGLVKRNYILIVSILISPMSIKQEERLLFNMFSKIKTVAKVLST